MKLYYSSTSPYARKVRLVLYELNLCALVEEIIMLPLDNPAELLKANPLAKVPVLITDYDVPVYNSPLICRYLMSIQQAPSLLPSGADKWVVLGNEALADGMTDAAFSLVMENLRNTDKQSLMWKARWSNAIKRSLDQIEVNLSQIDQTTIRLDHLAFGAALSYLEFRLPKLLSADQHPNCHQWLEQFSKNPSMLATQY